MSVIDMDAKRDQLVKVAKWVTLGVGAAVAGPIAYLALQGVVAIAAFVGVTFVIWNFAPVVATYVANKRIQALVAAVEANPIETMQNLFIEKSKDLSTADGNIRDFDTEIRNFDDQVDTFKKDYPEEAPTYVELSKKMHGALESMKVQQRVAREELAHFEQQITKAKAIYRMSMAASKVVKLSKSAEAQVFAHIKEQVAFDAVRTSLNQAFANLDMALERRKDAVAAPAPKQLPPAAEAVVVSPPVVTHAPVARTR